ncbi:helix-turn-helix domain-containing protein [Anaerococcus sp. WCA-380-WT-2B]|uniref:Helix-turn-helix domain-containing protein n=1 Tax=Anaerococcus porci TaxID=2652269 RepID=A0A6N7VUP3_9FIRM|nr:LexA family transcriptional regulator [Anaerococcus porci]MSS77419.1 helix-turn-helix domain-containing protein [Anaerococcus porci]
MDVSSKLKNLRKNSKMTQLELAKKLFVTKSAVSMYERGERIPSTDVLKKYSEIFDVSIDYLLGEQKDHLEPLARAVSMYTYPYIDDYISAGSPVNIDGMQNLPRIHIPDEILGKFAGSKHLSFIKVNGESMNKIIPNGSIIGVLNYNSIYDLKNGDIVVYKTKDNDFAVKYFYHIKNKLIFKPSSTLDCYYDKIFDINENIEIIGKVVLYSVIL